MSRMNEHHIAKCGIEGKCSVPLFGAYGPAGFCDRPAYGEQYEGQLSRFYTSSRGPYAPGLCCSIHGGAGEDDIRMVRDGSQWCAFRPDFENLQESIAGFGDTQETALANLLFNEATPAGDSK